LAQSGLSVKRNPVSGIRVSLPEKKKPGFSPKFGTEWFIGKKKPGFWYPSFSAREKETGFLSSSWHRVVYR
jgi:hypothetical protein